MHHSHRLKLPYRSAFYNHTNPHSLVLLIDEQSRHPLPRPNTHTRQQDLLLRPSRLAQDRRDLSRARRAQRVTQRDRATSHIYLRVVETQHVDAVDSHGCKGLVDLEEVDVVLGQVEFVKEFGDGDRGADAHDARGEAGDGGAAEFGEDGLAEFDGFGAFHEEDSGGWG